MVAVTLAVLARSFLSSLLNGCVHPATTSKRMHKAEIRKVFTVLSSYTVAPGTLIISDDFLKYAGQEQAALPRRG